jgi:hypothetical protein
VELLARRRALEQLEETRRRRLAELQTLAREQRRQLAPSHPFMRNTEDRLAALAPEPPEVKALRAEEQSLLAEFVGLGGKDSELSPESAPLWPAELLEASPPLVLARRQLELALERSARLHERLADARAGLSAAESVAQQRQALAEPAPLPRRPLPPGRTLLAGVALLASALFGVLAALAVDARAGRLWERWQVEEELGLPVVAEVGGPCPR